MDKLGRWWLIGLPCGAHTYALSQLGRAVRPLLACRIVQVATVEGRLMPKLCRNRMALAATAMGPARAAPVIPGGRWMDHARQNGSAARSGKIGPYTGWSGRAHGFMRDT